MAEVLTALAGREHAVEGAVRMVAAQPRAAVAIEGAGERALAAALGGSARGAVPAPRRAARSGSVTVLSSGPGQWLVVDERESGEAWHARLRAALDENACVTDLTHARVAIAIEGEQAASVLLAGCALDIEAMAPGDCAATRLAHFHVLIECVRARSFRLFVTRSFAVAAWDWLLNARAEFED